MQPVKRKQSLDIYSERQNCNDVACATWTACLIFSTLGRTRLILGVTGDKNATSYKRPPIIGEVDRSVIVGGLKLVDEVICQSPLAWIRQVEKKMKSKRFGAGNCASHE